MKKSFETCGKKGFHITFPNGVTLSTQIGPANYCDNYNEPIYGPAEEKVRDYASWEAEAAAWDKNNKWITDEYRPESGGVLGYLDMKEWLKFFDWCRAYKTPSTGKELNGE